MYVLWIVNPVLYKVHYTWRRVKMPIFCPLFSSVTVCYWNLEKKDTQESSFVIQILDQCHFSSLYYEFCVDFPPTYTFRTYGRGLTGNRCLIICVLCVSISPHHIVLVWKSWQFMLSEHTVLFIQLWECNYHCSMTFTSGNQP